MTLCMSSKEFADLIAAECDRIGAEPIFELIEWMANLRPEEIMTESKKDGVPLTLKQAKKCSEEARVIVNLFLVDD